MSAKKSSSKRVVKTQPQASKVVAESKAKFPVDSSARTQTSDELPFSRKNYILLIAGILIIALGFFLMSLDDFVDATQFSVSLYIAPVLVVGGFIEIIFAIMYKEKTQGISE